MSSIEEFIKTVEKLRSPDGCPWDKEQTHKTLKRYLIEETYEAIDAIENDDSEELKEELGDVLLQIVLHSQIAKENNKFTFNDVAENINKKMISRHPHVFGDLKLNNADEVLAKWDDFKRKEKPERKDIFEGIPDSLPALLKGLKVSKKSAKNGFDWENDSTLWQALKKEQVEIENAAKDNNTDALFEEIGDFLFMVVNIARWYKIDPEEALNKGIKKFIRRYKSVESLSNCKLNELNVDELNNLWEKVKHSEKI